MPSFFARLREWWGTSSQKVFWGPSFREQYRIDQAGAMYSVAYIACEMVKARTVGSLPVRVYEPSADGGSSKLTDHPLTRLLGVRWNPLMTAADGWHWLMLRKDTYGEAFVRVRYEEGVTKQGHRYIYPTALYPVKSDVTVLYDIERGTVAYEVEGEDGFTKPGRYQDGEIVHFKTPITEDGVKPRSIAELAATEIGLTIDIEKFYSQMIRNGMHFSGYLSTDETLTDRDLAQLQGLVEGFSGVDEAGKTRIFTNGLKWHQNPVEIGTSVLLEQQLWHLQQVCRVTNVPPQKVYDLSRATYSNVEQGQIDFVQSTVLPEVKYLEQVIQSILDYIGEPNRYVKFDLSGLMRGAYKDRVEGYRVGVYAGIYTRAEVRSWEELPYLPGSEKLLVPRAYGLLGASGDVEVFDAKEAATRIAENSIAPILTDTEERIKQRIRSDGDTERTREFITKALLPIANAHIAARLPYDMAAETERIINEAQE